MLISRNLKNITLFGVNIYTILFASLISFSFTGCTNTEADDLIVGGDLDVDSKPSGDTSSLEGNYGSGLKTAWSYKLEKTHTTKLKYTPGVWNAYYNTDIREKSSKGDIIFDIYGGNTTSYIVGVDQQKSGNTSGKYDREHTFPKSWWNSSSVDSNSSWTYMYTDIYHVLPCDHDLNSIRLNYPYGEPSKVSFTSESGCKLGTQYVSQVGTLTVFEPRDEVKGDLARIYFYFATRYEREALSTWGTSGKNILTYTAYPFYKQWTIDLLLKWHRQDPVSKREQDRNDAVSDEQGNRNPFVDYPELVEHIWGDKKNENFYFKKTVTGVEK